MNVTETQDTDETMPTGRSKRGRYAEDDDDQEEVASDSPLSVLQRRLEQFKITCLQMESTIMSLEQENVVFQEALLELKGDVDVVRSDRNTLVWYKEQYEWMNCHHLDAMRVDGLVALNAHLVHLQGKVTSKISKLMAEEDRAIKGMIQTNGRTLVASKAMEGCVVCGDPSVIADHVFCPCSHYMCHTCADKQVETYEMNHRQPSLTCPMCRTTGSIMRLRGVAEVVRVKVVDSVKNVKNVKN